MSIKIGSRVRVKPRPDWVKDPGYPLEGAEGRVVKLGQPDGFVEIFVEKTAAPINTGAYITLLDSAVEEI